MSYVNGTTHYNLPQTVGSDKRDWSDTNKAYADIDAAIYSANEDVDGLQSRVTTAEENIGTLQENVNTNTTNIASLTGRVTTNEQGILTNKNDITDLRNDSEDIITAYNEADATSDHAYAVGDYFIYNNVLYRCTVAIAVGDTIVPNTNCFATNVTTEIKNRWRFYKYPFTADNLTSLLTAVANAASLYDTMTPEKQALSTCVICNDTAPYTVFMRSSTQMWYRGTDGYKHLTIQFMTVDPATGFRNINVQNNTENNAGSCTVVRMQASGNTIETTGVYSIIIKGNVLIIGVPVD